MSKAKDFKPLINDLFLFGDGDFGQFDAVELFELLQAADDAYHNTNAPLLTDEQYDALHKFCETVNPSNTYFLGVGSNVRGGKVKLPYTMGSLTQTYIGGEVEKWIGQHNLTEEDVVITEKLDGYSTLLVYDATGALQIAYSRGDGIEGADITRHISKIPNVPKQISGPAVIRAEIIFSKADWEKVKLVITRSGGEFYKNARNCVSGLMNASESAQNALDALSVVGYSVVSHADSDKIAQLNLMEVAGFKTPVYVNFPGAKCTDEFLTKVLNLLRTRSNYEIDGIVLDVDKATLRNKINPSKNTLNPEFARKFKVADASNLAVAEVIEVQWNASKNGYMKPRVKIKPVELVGVTVQHATGFNAKFIVDNGIGPGAKIRITRSGDVIPFIVGVVESAKAQLPTEETTWGPTGVDLILVDANNNDTVKLEQLIDFAAKVGIEFIGEGNMKSIYDAGYTTVTDFVKMMSNDIGLAIGSSVMGKKIAASKDEKLHNVPWYVIAGSHPAFGRGIGVRKMKKLYDAFEGDIKKLNVVPEILGVEGFEFKTASKIAAGYEVFMEFVEDCSSSLSFAKYEAPKQGTLTGESFLFTGFRSSELETKIIEQGGRIASSVSSKLTYLVALDVNESSGKLKKARDVGTKIITRDQLEELLS